MASSAPKDKRRKAAGGERQEPAAHAGHDPKSKGTKVPDEDIFVTDNERACVHIAMKAGREAAANALSWTMAEVKACLQRPHVKHYAAEYRERFTKALVDKSVAELRRLDLTPVRVQQRLMDLALTPPSETKGSIDGQVKALQELAAHFGLKKDDPLAGKSSEELQAIIDGARNKVAKSATVQ